MVVGRNEKFLSPTCKCPALCNPNEVTEQCPPRERGRKYFPSVSTQCSNWARKVASKSGNHLQPIGSHICIQYMVAARVCPSEGTMPYPTLSFPGLVCVKLSAMEQLSHGKKTTTTTTKIPLTRFSFPFVVFHSFPKLYEAPVPCQVLFQVLRTVSIKADKYLLSRTDILVKRKLHNKA